MSSNEDRVREILCQALGIYSYDIVALAGEASDIIRGDRLTIKILSRNIESLTMQMKGITQVTYERDIYKERWERQKDINEHLWERLKKYE